MSELLKDIPQNYTFHLLIKNDTGERVAYTQDFVSALSQDELRMIKKLPDVDVQMFDTINLDFKEFPKDYSVQITLFDDKNQQIGFAVNQMDFLWARREHYNECGLQFNLSEIWKTYCSYLPKKQ